MATIVRAWNLHRARSSGNAKDLSGKKKRAERIQGNGGRKCGGDCQGLLAGAQGQYDLVTIFETRDDLHTCHRVFVVERRRFGVIIRHGQTLRAPHNFLRRRIYEGALSTRMVVDGGGSGFAGFASHTIHDQPCPRAAPSARRRWICRDVGASLARDQDLVRAWRGRRHPVVDSMSPMASVASARSGGSRFCSSPSKGRQRQTLVDYPEGKNPSSAEACGPVVHATGSAMGG